jgi:hypothetical protein
MSYAEANMLHNNIRKLSTSSSSLCYCSKLKAQAQSSLGEGGQRGRGGEGQIFKPTEMADGEITLKTIMKFSSVTVVILAIASVAEVHSFSISKHSCRIISTTSLIKNHYRLRSAKSNSEEEKAIIDAIVEEKTAGLALDDVGGEENTTVSVYITKTLNLNVIFTFSSNRVLSLS